MKLSNDERLQYDRHLILEEIGEVGQMRLKNAKVLLIGIGGLGCPIAQYLTAAGVGTIGIVDDDKVSQSNLQRQVLFTHQDIGKDKVSVAVAKLQALNPYVQFNKHIVRLDSSNVLEIFQAYDLVVDGSDNFPTRYLVNDASLICKKPLVYGAIYKFEGQVAVFNYKGSASYRCLFPTAPKPEERANCSEIGVLGVLPGIVGTLQANEVLKIILEKEQVLYNKVIMFNTLNMQFLNLNLEPSDEINRKNLAANYDFFCGIDREDEITLAQYNNNPEAYFLVDVRTKEERMQYHIGGVNIPLSKLAIRSKEIPRSKNIIVYCKSGKRSKQAIAMLRDLQFTQKLLSLKNGVGH